MKPANPFTTLWMAYREAGYPFGGSKTAMLLWHRFSTYATRN